MSTILGILKVYNNFLNPDTVKIMDCKDNVDFSFSFIFHNFISLGCLNSWTYLNYIWTVYVTEIDRKKILIWTESRKLGCILRKCPQITGPKKAIGNNNNNNNNKQAEKPITGHLKSIIKKKKKVGRKSKPTKNKLQWFWNELVFLIHSS